METEQMAEVYGRQPMGSSKPTCRNCGQPAHGGRCSFGANGPRPAGVEMTHEAKVQTPHPIPARTLRALVASVPDDAEFYVSPIMGGSQRDPEVTGYRIRAEWSTS